jgi:hypothetical protein
VTTTRTTPIRTGKASDNAPRRNIFELSPLDACHGCNTQFTGEFDGFEKVFVPQKENIWDFQSMAGNLRRTEAKAFFGKLNPMSRLIKRSFNLEIYIWRPFLF